MTGARYAFAALKSDGSVVTWGRPHCGGNSGSVAAQLSSGVQSIQGNLRCPFGAAQRGAFAALKSDGSMVTWGDPEGGGDSSSVAAQLSSGVQSVTGNIASFAALKSDGSLVTWGHPRQAGDSSSVDALVYRDT